MNCFNHPDIPAVGQCKSCLKGLCKNCAVEFRNGLACKGSCEQQVKLLDSIFDVSIEARRRMKRQAFVQGLSALVMGGGFLFFAIWTYCTMAESFLPYLFGLLALGIFLTSVPLFGRKDLYQLPDKPKA